MTSAEEQKFIRLWQQGRTSAAIAQALGVPLGTSSSRPHTLQRQGKIQPRPRGGAYPTQRRQAALPGVSNGVSGGTLLPAERGPSVRWNLHFSARLRERIKALATARGLQDSQTVEELLWVALAVVEEDPAGEAGWADKRDT
jgi:hypothetical protein